MRRILILVLLLAATTSFGQKLRFSYQGNQWRTKGYQPDCNMNSWSQYYTDTTIFGKQYKRLRRRQWLTPAYPGAVCPGFFDHEYYIREDTINGFVFYSMADTNEYVLYNYNLNPGDTIQYQLPSAPPCTDSVIGIDSILINGLYHKIWKMHNIGSTDRRAYAVVEGLGCTNGPLFPTYFGGCFEVEEILRCFARDTTYPGIIAPLGMCSYSFGNFYNVDCNVILEIAESATKAETISIYPNPTTDHINITTNTSNIQASICNAVGQCMYTTSFRQNKEANISTTLWPAGLYIITIQNESEILKREKIIIAH